MAQANMYRVTVGDFVYFEQSPSAPYLIRKIDELTMTPNKNVEARCLCFYRRRDLPPNLLVMADRYSSFYDEYQDEEGGYGNGNGNGMTNAMVTSSPMKTNKSSVAKADEHLLPRQLHQVKHRELYISRQVETLPATGIRGKCTVTLLNEEEALTSYLNTEDAFFYSLKYDPQQKALNTDRGDIKVGSKYQVDVIPPVNRAEALARSSEQFETLVWKPEAALTDEQISQFVIVAKAVGLYARAVDVNSSVRSPSLHSAAIMSSRDSIIQYAVDVLHRAKYDVAEAMKELVPAGTGPALVRDQLEEWSPAEAALFEEGLDKYGKDFENIRADLLGWKSIRSLVEFYYIWKSTDRYQNRRKAKASENENKMKQVYIPAHTKPNPAMITQKGQINDGKTFCESCGTTDAAQWFAWSQQGSAQAQQVAQQLVAPVQQAQHKLCVGCWNYWKKYGGLKQESRLDGAGGRPDPGQRAERVQQMQQNMVKKMVQCQVPECSKVFRNRQHMLRHLYNTHEVYVTETGTSYPLIKTPSAFVMTTTLATSLMRRLLAHGAAQLSRVPRNPTQPIDFARVHKEYNLIPEATKRQEAKRLRLRRRKLHFLATGLRRLNVDLTMASPEWLQRTPADVKQPAKLLAFPKPDHMPWPDDQQPLNDRKANQPSIMRKRTVDAAAISPTPGRTTPSQPPARSSSSANNATPSSSAASAAAAANLPANLTTTSSSSAANLANNNNTATNLTTAATAHQNGVGPTPAKQQHLSSPTHGSSSRNSNSRPPVHYPPPNHANNNGNSHARSGGRSTNGVGRPSGNGAGGEDGATDEFTPDDMFFVVTTPTRTARKVLSASALRKASRRPFSAIRPIITTTGAATTVSALTAPAAAAVKTDGATLTTTAAAALVVDGHSNNGNGNGNGTTLDMTNNNNSNSATKLAAAADGRQAMVVD